MKATRRALVGGLGASVLTAPHLARADRGSVLKFIPQADLGALDPIWSTAVVTQNHGWLVFDTLYGTADDFSIQPQMVQGDTVEQDGRLWRLTLREGLRFHDGEPVRAQDAVASIRRWGARDGFGTLLMAATAELSAPSDRVIQFRLHRPFPQLRAALGKTTPSLAAIMPERLAATDPAKQVTEMVGSGPYRFLADEHLAGAHVAYAKFDGYVPRAGEQPSYTAGPKRAYFDRVEWTVMPDSSSAAAAMQAGEMDWWESPALDLVPLLKRSPHLAIHADETSAQLGMLRFNALYPPFDNPAARRALLPAVDQADFMQAIAGDQTEFWRAHVGVFAAGSPMASDAGVDVMNGDVEASRRLLAAAGYNGERIVVLAPSDFPAIFQLGQVGADMLKRAGMNVDLQLQDWGTVVQRRASRSPPAQGGWNIFFTTLSGMSLFDPIGQLGLRGNGDAGWFGWPKAPRLEELRMAWLDASDLATQKAIARDIQLQAWQDAPFLPLGQLLQPMVHRRDLTGIVKGASKFYGVHRT
jgi:peptide/nickel transport system substrate-binding protein